MMNHIIKYKRPLFLLLLALAANAYWVINLKKASAQACITIMPTIRYGSLSGTTTGGQACVGPIAVNVPAPGVGYPYVGLTGWEVSFTRAPDHEHHEIAASVTPTSYSKDNVIVSVGACLNGDDQTYQFSWKIDYVVARWR